MKDISEQLLDKSGGFVVPEVFLKELQDSYEQLDRPFGVLRFAPPFKITRRQRLNWWWSNVRERVGFWIAGYTPSDDEY